MRYEGTGFYLSWDQKLLGTPVDLSFYYIENYT